MNILDDKSQDELLKSLLASVAKAQNEIRSAEADINKAIKRNQFNIMLINKMIERETD
ncbi:hypothetical protein N9991_00260 [bacterium]|jgi:hypothetical protein|nr:hypothetical protein [bacterium]